MNLEPISIFYFNARFVTKIESGFKANPFDFDHALNPVNVNVNAVHYGNPHPTKPYRSNPTPPISNPTPSQPHSAPHCPYSNHNRSKPNPRPVRPCCLCIYKEFNTVYYTLSEQCGVHKLSSADIIKIIDITRTCPSCGCVHLIGHQCKTVFPDGRFKICTKGCKHNGYPLHYAACKHNDKTPSCTISVNKIDTASDSERSIPLVETINIGPIPIGIQNDNGCQIRLMSKSILQQLPEDIYSIGKSVKLWVLTYAGKGQVISTNSVKLNVNGFMLKLLAIDTDHNNGSAYSFPTW